MREVRYPTFQASARRGRVVKICVKPCAAQSQGRSAALERLVGILAPEDGHYFDDAIVADAVVDAILFIDDRPREGAVAVSRTRKSRQEGNRGYSLNMPPPEKPLPWPLPDALAVARQMLAGDLGLIEGSIVLASYAHSIAPDWRIDPDLLIFGALASETDHLPFGEVRSHWSPAGLVRADAEIEKITEVYRTKVQTACENLVARFGDVPRANPRTVTLYRPVGPKELELIAASKWREFPPRLPGQSIFYPVTNEAYAAQIARDWNVKESGAGFVTKFEIDADYLCRYPEQKVGGAMHTEYWIPAENLEEFNQRIVGRIEVIGEFR